MKLIQSWDDGVVDDARLAELCRKHGATATFNLNLELNEPERVFGWMHGEKEVWRLARGEMVERFDGFEIASHSLTHPHLTRCTPAELKDEVERSRSLLQEMFAQPIEGFCYPYGDRNDAVKDAVRAAGYTHARGTAGRPRRFPPDDPLEFNPHCHFLSERFWDLYDEAKRGDEPVFFFWGHSYEILDEAMWADYEDKLARLTADAGNAWVNISELFR